MPGPNSWKGDKKRLKRPQTKELKLSLEQNVGRAPIYKPPKHTAAAGGVMKKPFDKKKAKKPLQGAEKRLRTLNKLLVDIEALQQRETRGETLDEQQLAKLDRLDDVLTEMDELMGDGGS